MNPKIHTARDGAVETIWFNNPPFNFMTSAMVTDLQSIIDSVDRDPAVRVVVLASAVEGVFISHYELSEILAGVEAAGTRLTRRTAAAALRASAAADALPGGQAAMAKAGAAGVADLRHSHQLFAQMRDSSMIFIAAINGRAMGGGCELAMACDMRVMADGPFEIGQPEILVGITPGWGGTQMLPRIVGTGLALELCLDGRPLTPAQALQVGLVGRLVEPDELMPTVAELGARLAQRSPTAVQSIKRAVYAAGTTTMDKGMHVERVGFLASASTPSAKRAMVKYIDDVADASTKPDPSAVFATQNLPRWLDGADVHFDE